MNKGKIMLRKKTVVLGISAGIAAYKIATLASLLVKNNFNVHVIMTENATKFISPLTFETLTKNKCYIDTFSRDFTYEVEHIELAKKADLFIVAPATANIIAKLAHGIADDMLSTVSLAMKCPKLIVPAMNTAMYENKIVRDNIISLKKYNFDIMEADFGYLACGDVGAGKMPAPEEIFDRILYHIEYEKDLIEKEILISAGATIESIDPVRFITNHSTGKMGIELAKAAYNRGARVNLVLGKSSIKVPKGINVVNVLSANDMFEVIKDYYKSADIIIKSAAVSDYTPKFVSDTKLKKTEENFSLELKKTEDILLFLGKNKRKNQFLCGFSMETENLIENSRSKLINKNLDMIVANNLKQTGAGFGTDTNIVSIITKDREENIDLVTKKELANIILDRIKDML